MQVWYFHILLITTFSQMIVWRHDLHVQENDSLGDPELSASIRLLFCMY